MYGGIYRVGGKIHRELSQWEVEATDNRKKWVKDLLTCLEQFSVTIKS